MGARRYGWEYQLPQEVHGDRLRCLSLYADRGPGRSPTITCPVIPARGCELRDFPLYCHPIEARARAAFENYGQPSGTGTIDVESPTTDINRSANLWKALTIPPSAHLLIRDNRHDHDDEKDTKNHQDDPVRRRFGPLHTHYSV